MGNHAKQKGDLRRETRCQFCGGLHRRHSKEARECRKRSRAGKAPLERHEPVEASPATAGSEITHYENDPLRGNKRAHAIARMSRAGFPPRKIAKTIGIPLQDVKDVLARLG